MLQTLTRNTKAGSSIVELLVGLTIFLVMVGLLADSMSSMAKSWSQGESRIERVREARAALELFTREIKPAVVDTKMQFAIAPASELLDKGDKYVDPNSLAVMWMAPLGERNLLHSVGYYLQRDVEKGKYRLKRVLIGPRWADGTENAYYPKLVNRVGSDTETKANSGSRSEFKDDTVSPLNADWFFKNWDEDTLSTSIDNIDKTVTAVVAENVVAFWVQCYDALGNPVPWVSHSTVHPTSNLVYNSAAYFTMATTLPFDDGKSFRYKADQPMVMRANQVPVAVEVRIVTVDRAQLLDDRVPPVSNAVMDEETLDLDKTISEFTDKLLQEGFPEYKVYSTRVKLLNGS